MKYLRPAIAVVLLSLGCGSASTSDPSTEGTGTDPVLPPATCAAGTMPKLPEGTCEPVGTTKCADGFEADASGWGCTAILPAAACGDGMRAQIGKRDCVAVDDCSAAFPPAGAYAVITPATAATLDATLAAAPAGSTIAIDEGTYVFTTVLQKNLTFVGRCASKVKLQSAKGSAIEVGTGANVEVRSVTLSAAQNPAVYAVDSGHATLTNVIVSDSLSGVGASRLGTVKVTSSLILGNVPAAENVANGASGAYTIRGGTVTLEDSELRGFPAALASMNESSKVTVTRSIVSYDGASDDPGMTLGLAAVGGTIEATESTLRSSRIQLLSATDDLGDTGTNPGGKGANAHFVGSELSQVGASKPLVGTILVTAGGSVTVEETTVVHESDAAFRVYGGTSSFASTASVVRVGPVQGLEHAALHLLSGATAKIEKTAIVDPVQYGIVALGTGVRLDMKTSLVSGTAYRPSDDGQNVGVALGLSVNEAATATVTESTVLGSHQYGVHASGGGQVIANALFVDATTAPDGVPGGAAFMADETARMAILSSAVRGSADAAFVFRSGGNLVGDTAIVGNGVVLRLTGAPLSQLDAAPDGEVDDAVVFYSNHMHDNGTFMSADLPPAVAPPPFKTTP